MQDPRQGYASSRLQAEYTEDPLNFGLVHHIDRKDSKKLQPEEAQPLFPARRRRSGDDDEDAEDRGRRDSSLTGLLAAAKASLVLALLFIGIAMLSKYGRYMHISVGASAPSAEKHHPPPEARYCLRKLSGDPNVTTGNHSDLPNGAHTVYANFRTTEPGQKIATWGDGCGQLLLTDAGTLEYRRRFSRHSHYHTISDSDIIVTDGFWHEVAIVIYKSGKGKLFIDGSLAAGGDLSEESHGCPGLEEVHFHGSIESLRVFYKPLPWHQIGLIRESEDTCRWLIYTSTSTTTTATSTSTQTSTKTVTTTRPWSNASELPAIVVNTPPPLPTSTKTATFTSTSTETATFTSTSTETATKTTTLTSTRTSTLTSTRTTTTRTSTSTTTAMPEPIYFGSGHISASGIVEFLGAALPADGKGLTLMANIHTSQGARRQEIISWGTADREDGCVSLHLSDSGTLEYSELAAGNSAWTTVTATSGKSLADGKWHTVAVSRSPTGIAYLYVDSLPAGQGMLLAPRPWDLDSVGKAAGTCNGEPSATIFDGSITGVHVFASAFTAWQLAEEAERLTSPGRRLRAAR